MAARSGGVTDAALNELGTALHTVSDRLSPSHSGEQLWTGAFVTCPPETARS